MKNKEKILDKEKELLKKGNKTWEEFKQFISKGNALDLAVGVIIGSAFGKIVSSIVDDILMPLVGVFIGGIDFSNLTITIKDSVIRYGNFIQNVVDFLIIAACIFFIVKFIKKLEKKQEPEKTEAPVKEPNTALLEEIRDLLKESSKL